MNDPAPKPRHGLYWLVACPTILLIWCPATWVLGVELGRQRHYGNEAAAIGSIKRLVTAEEQLRERTGSYGTLAELSSATLVDPILGSGTKQGYLYACVPSSREPAKRFVAVAAPLSPPGSPGAQTEYGPSGEQWFAANQNAQVVGARAAIPLDPELALPASPAHPTQGRDLTPFLIACLAVPIVAHLLAMKVSRPKV